VNTAEDGRLLLPAESWLEKDLRSVKRAGGSFECEVDEDGNHGDTFDAIKLALHALTSGGGPAEAQAAPVGSYRTRGGPGRPLKNPYANLHERKPGLPV
jgi:hypothetical protein